MFPSKTYNDSTLNPWILDTGANHHITDDSMKLMPPHDYTGGANITMGNGNNIHITYTGSVSLSTPSVKFSLCNILCAPDIKKNLISVSQFCKKYNTSIEFFPFEFLVKALSTEAPLLSELNKDYLYI